MDAKHHKYENVPVGEDHDGSRSSTEVESLIGDEKQWHTEELGLRRKKTCCSKVGAAFQTWRWVIDTVMLLAILGLLIKDQLRQQPYTPWEIGGDFTGGLTSGAVSQKITTFENDLGYCPMNSSEFFTNETMHKWNDLMPRGMGFVWVNNTENYHDLPTPIIWPEKTVFTTSMTHQIHCLYTLAHVYSGLKANHSLPEDHHWHVTHCISFMRQAIMCSADIALEGLETTFPDHNGGSDGWDSKHVCKDYSEVYSYLESVRAYDDRLIY
ncbi:hypothetical protein GQ53DRAFT_633365 [Thozetella sp. PMI_491]|nr:hypothetical protein GQ53DRAFT_633365 [Thozetella sp. PMI_491]